jgi:polyhydroxybutyrate depolymerase
MTASNRALVPLLLAALLVGAPSAGAANKCVRGCKTEITACRTACIADGTRPRRCKKTCRKAAVASCRTQEGLCFPTTTTTTVSASTTTTTLPAPCGDACPTGFFPEEHVTTSGVDRTYALYVPETYDPEQTYALVFAYHGDGGTGAGIRGALGLETPANGAAIFVYPNATEESGRSFTLDTDLAANPDMQMFLDLVGQLSARFSIQGVFATGLSRGGYFANFLNCALGASQLDAVAPQAGSGPYGEDDSEYDEDGHYICPSAPAAALMIHGVDDEVVPIPDAEYSRSQWVWGNGCEDSTFAVAPSPCVEHEGCDEGKPVVWCAVPGLAHDVWDQAAETIWAFFARF